MTRFQFLSVLEKEFNVMSVGENFKAYSFRTGAATATYETGCYLVTIMESGHWKSKLFKFFVRVNLLGSLLSAVFLGQFHELMNKAFICIKFAGF